MKTQTYLVCFFILLAGIAAAQTTTDKSSATNKRDAILLSKFKAKGTYPLVKASPFCGAIPITGATEKPDTNMKYKLLFSFTTGTNDPQKVKELNRGLAEIGRIINLHLAAGVPRQNIEVVIVAHRKALYALYNNEAFKKEFKADNPNAAILKELESAGARFVACGQAMQFLEIPAENLLPEVKIAVAAKVALSTYQQKGFVLYDIDEED